LNDPGYIDELEFKIDKPEYFLRNVNVYTRYDSKKRWNDLSDHFVLDSKSPLLFPTRIWTKELWLEIVDEDNAPLKITGIKCLQLNHYMVANLEKSRQYELHFSDSQAAKPSYDLRYFSSGIPSSVPLLAPGSLTELKQAAKAEVPVKNIFADKRMIWAVLIVVVGLLGLITYRMISEAR
jgi:hypothetical protein